MLGGGGGTPEDRDTLAGVSDLLRVVAGSTDRRTALFAGDLSPEIRLRIGLPSRELLPHVRPAIASFLNARRVGNTDDEINSFQVCFACYGPIALKGADEEPADIKDKVTLILEWNPVKTVTPYDQRMQLYLPTSLPQDRSDRTRIE